MAAMEIHSYDLQDRCSAKQACAGLATTLAREQLQHLKGIPIGKGGAGRTGVGMVFQPGECGPNLELLVFTFCPFCGTRLDAIIPDYVCQDGGTVVATAIDPATGAVTPMDPAAIEKVPLNDERMRAAVQGLGVKH